MANTAGPVPDRTPLGAVPDRTPLGAVPDRTPWGAAPDRTPWGAVPDRRRASTPRRGHPAAALVAIAAVLIAGLAGTLAFRSPGYSGSSVSSAPRSVWVTNSTQFLLGRINRQIDELDSAVVLSSGDFDVLQEGTTVVAVDRTAHQLRVVDPATVSLSRGIRIPDDAAVDLGGGVVAIADRAKGLVWTLPVSGLAAAAGTDITADAPALITGPGTVLAVSQDGTVAATAPGADAVLTLAPGTTAGKATTAPSPATSAGTPTSRPTASAPATTVASPAAPQPSADLPVTTLSLDRPLSRPSAAHPVPVSLAMIGDDPAVLDTAANRIMVRGKDFPLPDGTTTATLQTTGPAADAVLVATHSLLLQVSLGDGTVRSFDPGVTGNPAAPVWLDGCAYAAWAGATPTYLSWCGSVPQVRPLPNSDSAHPLVFRVNGPEIVLNDTTSGAVWALDAKLAVISDWSQVAPEDAGDTVKAPDVAVEQRSEQDTLSRTDCSKSVAPPTAVADTAGVRAGRPTVIPVMSNDATTDCSVVVIDKVSGWAAATGATQIADSGLALQVTTATGVTGTLPPLTYEITDGAGHTSTSSVTVSVVPADQHPAPRRIRDSAVVVGPNGTVSSDVLADWESTSGDPLWLTGVEADGQDLAVGFQASGSITVHDTGVAGPGKRTVTFALTDGTNIEHGVLVVDVVGDADARPIASPVYATGTVGRPVVVDALAAVTNPSDQAARISSITPPAAGGGLSVIPNLDAGTVSVTASAPGSYQIGYVAVAGAATASGVIRVVITAADPEEQPVPVTDVAYLPQSGQVRVDLTANDIDSAGGVLAVQQMAVPATAPIVVTLTDMHVAEISARRSLPAGGVWFSYQVTDGGPPVTGWVHVVAVPVRTGTGPSASAARISVRAGDAATLDVTSVAVDADGNAMTVQPFVALKSGQGLLFASGDEIRYLAPASPPATPITTTYTVVDSAGRSDTASLTITVVPVGANQPPQVPPAAVARVFAGGTVTIALPLAGTDPDGDWVSVGEIDDPGRLGSAAIAGPDSISYHALSSSAGADSVTYTAVDRFGGSVVGRVDMVVVPLPSVAEPPVAPDLKVSVAPGRMVGVDVLGEVQDPADSMVKFAPGTPEVPPGAGVTASIVDGVLAVAAGADQTVVPITYTVVNALGLSASGVVTVTVTPDAPPMPPTASDVWVTAAMLSSDRTDAVVDVSAFVTNPSGRVSDLTVTLPAGPSGAGVTGRTVTIPLTGQRRVLAYQVRDSDGLTATAFIVVPERTTLVPDQQSNTSPAGSASNAATTAPFNPQHTTKQLTATAGTTVTVAVADYITGAAPGHTVTIPASANTHASVGTLTRIDAGTLRWVIPDTAKGGDALLWTDVTDGTTAASSAAIPATVIPKAIPAPVLYGTDVTIAAGGSTTVSLASLVKPGGPNQPLTFAGPTGQTLGVTGSVSGSTLTIGVRADTRKGTVVDLGVTVSDGVHPPVPATVAVTVIRSSAPLATVPDVTVTSAVPGAAVTRNVLRGAINPLPGVGPLRVLSPVQVLQGTARATVSGGDSITVVPATNQVGLVIVQFTVADATADPDRYVTATMSVTVRGRPDPIGTPTVVSVGDRSAVLKWGVPAANGAPITGYTVSSGSYHHSCAATPCTLGGLTNNEVYRFAVVAHNAAGDSTASPASAPVRPDVAPAAPAAPDVRFGDDSVTARWPAPADSGSPITGYLVTIAPRPSSTPAWVHVTGTSHTFKNLRNGTAYTVRVVAQNSSGTNSPASPSSDPVVPAGIPGTPGAPALIYSQAQAANSRIDVSWDAVNGNGDDQVAYTVRWTASDRSSGTVRVPAGGPTMASITGVQIGIAYSVSVSATNKAGTSPAGPRSTLTPFDTPGRMSKPDAEATGVAGTVSLTWHKGITHGAPITQYQYTYDGGSSWISVGTALTAAVTGLTNGRSYVFQVRACDGQTFRICGQPSAASDPVIPYGPIRAPSVSVQQHFSWVAFEWTQPADNGLEPYRYQLTVNGQSYQPVDDPTASQWYSYRPPNVWFPAGSGCRVTIAVVAVDSQQHRSPPGTASASVFYCATVGAKGARAYADYTNPTNPTALPAGVQLGISCAILRSGTTTVQWLRVPTATSPWYVAAGDFASYPAGIPSC